MQEATAHVYKFDHLMTKQLDLTEMNTFHTQIICLSCKQFKSVSLAEIE